ncbi:MAG: hypothetical protein ACOYM5_03690 [Caulobacter sp.]
MVKLDVVKAAFSGFGVIGRNPLAVLVWALFLGIVGVAPAFALLGSFAGALARIIAVDKQGAEPTPDMILPMLGSIFALLPVLMLTGLVVRMVLTGAIYRAVLFPKDSSWFYLRLGARELWLALLFIVVGIISFLISMVMMGFALPVALLSRDQDPMVTMVIIRASMLPAYAVMAFLFVRFCLAFPMTFADSKFRLMESWAMTRGNGWRILLVLLLLIALALVAELILVVLILACLFAVIGAGALSGDWNEARITAFFAQDPSVWMTSLMPWVIGAGVVGCLAGALVTVIFTAPWADAYRQLAGSSEPAA